jgi:hypothetical protein
VANERATEDIVREHFKQYGLPQQRLEEQTSSIPSVRTALAAASEQGTGIGKPEFVITFPVTVPQLVIAVECRRPVMSILVWSRPWASARSHGGEPLRLVVTRVDGKPSFPHPSTAVVT